MNLLVFFKNILYSAMWKYLESLNKEFKTLATFSEKSVETVKQLLKKPPGKRSSIKIRIAFAAWYQDQN